MSCVAVAAPLELRRVGVSGSRSCFLTARRGRKQRRRDAPHRSRHAARPRHRSGWRQARLVGVSTFGADGPMFGTCVKEDGSFATAELIAGVAWRKAHVGLRCTPWLRVTIEAERAITMDDIVLQAAARERRRVRSRSRRIVSDRRSCAESQGRGAGVRGDGRNGRVGAGDARFMSRRVRFGRCEHAT